MWETTSHSGISTVRGRIKLSIALYPLSPRTTGLCSMGSYLISIAYEKNIEVYATVWGESSWSHIG